MENQIIIETISNYLKSLFTFENLTFLLGLIGSLGTTWTFIQSRKNIEFSIIKGGMKNNELIIFVQIINKSHLGIAISDVSLFLDGIIYPCQKERRICLSFAHERRQQVLLQDFYTEPFPLQLVGLGGTSAYLVFELPPDACIDFSKPQTLRISTNRGKVLEKQLHIPQTNGLV